MEQHVPPSSGQKSWVCYSLYSCGNQCHGAACPSNTRAKLLNLLQFVVMRVPVSWSSMSLHHQRKTLNMEVVCYEMPLTQMTSVQLFKSDRIYFMISFVTRNIFQLNVIEIYRQRSQTDRKVIFLILRSTNGNQVSSFGIGFELCAQSGVWSLRGARNFFLNHMFSLA